MECLLYVLSHVILTFTTSRSGRSDFHHFQKSKLVLRVVKGCAQVWATNKRWSWEFNPSFLICSFCSFFWTRKWDITDRWFQFLIKQPIFYTRMWSLWGQSVTYALCSVLFSALKTVLRVDLVHVRGEWEMHQTALPRVSAKVVPTRATSQQGFSLLCIESTAQQKRSSWRVSSRFLKAPATHNHLG